MNKGGQDSAPAPSSQSNPHHPLPLSAPHQLGLIGSPTHHPATVPGTFLVCPSQRQPRIQAGTLLLTPSPLSFPHQPLHPPPPWLPLSADQALLQQRPWWHAPCTLTRALPLALASFPPRMHPIPAGHEPGLVPSMAPLPPRPQAPRETPQSTGHAIGPPCGSLGHAASVHSLCSLGAPPTCTWRRVQGSSPPLFTSAKTWEQPTTHRQGPSGSNGAVTSPKMQSGPSSLRSPPTGVMSPHTFTVSPHIGNVTCVRTVKHTEPCHQWPPRRFVIKG